MYTRDVLFTSALYRHGNPVELNIQLWRPCCDCKFYSRTDTAKRRCYLLPWFCLLYCVVYCWTMCPYSVWVCKHIIILHYIDICAVFWVLYSSTSGVSKMRQKESPDLCISVQISPDIDDWTRQNNCKILFSIRIRQIRHSQDGYHICHKDHVENLNRPLEKFK